MLGRSLQEFSGKGFTGAVPDRPVVHSRAALAREYRQPSSILPLGIYSQLLER